MSTSSTGRSGRSGGAGTAGADAATPRSAAARLFDIRLLIGGLFLVYGLLLTVAGFFTSSSALKKADGININLWLGLGMLLVGAFFVLWLRMRPLQRPEPDEGTGPAVSAAAGRHTH